ncbi:MAG: peptidoglycan bridge formation glycyltransferase FemA/FemB family protein [Herpetosiphon sp.]
MTLFVRSWDAEPPARYALAWENMVQAAPASGFMQSLPWAAFKRARGLRTLHLLIEDHDTILGGAIFQIGGNGGPTLLIAPDGPVVPWHQPSLARDMVRRLMVSAEDLATPYGAIGMRIEPRLPSHLPAGALLRDWRRAPVDLLPRETLYLNLQPPTDAILAAMHSKGRYNIRLAFRHGVTVRTGSHADLPLLYVLLRETAERDDFFLEPYDYISDLITHLSPGGAIRLLVASRGATPLAAMLLLIYGRRATYLYGATSNEGRSHMAGYALQWAAIEQARLAGCTDYDFYGYEPNGAPNHLYAGFSRFKRQFGGEPQQFRGAHDHYWNDRLADAVIRALAELTGSAV